MFVSWEKKHYSVAQFEKSQQLLIYINQEKKEMLQAAVGYKGTAVMG